MKRERFFAHVYFSNETVSQTTVSTGPMKMFRLEHETMNVCQRNVARFGHVECMFDMLQIVISYMPCNNKVISILSTSNQMILLIQTLQIVVALCSMG